MVAWSRERDAPGRARQSAGDVRHVPVSAPGRAQDGSAKRVTFWAEHVGDILPSLVGALQPLFQFRVETFRQAILSSRLVLLLMGVKLEVPALSTIMMALSLQRFWCMRMSMRPMCMRLSSRNSSREIAPGHHFMQQKANLMDCMLQA